MSDKLVGHIEQRSDYNNGGQAFHNIYAQGGDMQRCNEMQRTGYSQRNNGQQEVLTYDNPYGTGSTNSYQLHDVKLYGYEQANTNREGVRQVHEAHASINVHNDSTSSGHYASDYDKVPNHEQHRRPQQGHITADGAGGYTGELHFPPAGDANGGRHQSGYIKVHVNAGQYHEGPLGNLAIPAVPGRPNHYNVLLNARYENGQLVGTPAHYENGRYTDAYPKEVHVKCQP
ncbi:MAG TPA: hypothetical protein V6C76_00990 [Drouetiella sp.]